MRNDLVESVDSTEANKENKENSDIGHYVEIEPDRIKGIWQWKNGGRAVILRKHNNNNTVDVRYIMGGTVNNGHSEWVFNQHCCKKKG